MINYCITLNPHTHIYAVNMQFIAQDKQHTLKLPTWIPGSYMIREFSKNIIAVKAMQQTADTSSPVACTQLNKNTWELNDLTINSLVNIEYSVYAYEAGIRTASLDNTRGYFNSSSICLYLLGYENNKHSITFNNLPEHWQIATTLAISKTKVGTTQFTADNYSALIDCPVELGTFNQYKFTVSSTLQCTLVLSGIIQPNIDVDRLTADIAKICLTQINLFSTVQAQAINTNQLAPFTHYMFILNLSGDHYTGIEHSDCTLLMAPYYSLPIKRTTIIEPDASDKQRKDYIKLLSLISHEFFHVWNVKRIKPKAFMPYNLEQENYTALLWWFEGITSYYDDLILYRSGLINLTEYLTIVNNNLNEVYQFTGVTIQSLADASLNSWIKYYRPDANSLNSAVSYYTKGAIVALCLDLLIRDKTKQQYSLDDVLAGLYHKWQQDQLGIAEKELPQLISTLAHCDLQQEIDQFINTCAPLPYTQLLAKFGISVHLVANQPEHSSGKVINQLSEIKPVVRCDLGCKLTKTDVGYTVVHVYTNSAAAEVGLAPGDLLLAIDNIKLNDYEKQISSYNAQDKITISLFRNEQLLHYHLTLSYPVASVSYLLVNDRDLLKNWLLRTPMQR